MGISKMARLMAWFVGACLALVALAYFVLIAINWSDEAPSREAMAMQQMVAGKPEVPDAANAWVFLLGLDAVAATEPLKQGGARKAWLANYTPAQRARYESAPGHVAPYLAARTPAIAALAETCKTGSAECLRLVHGDFAAVDGWLEQENWLLQRFSRMESLREWKEVVPKHVSAETTDFRPATSGQQLLLMQAWKDARVGDGNRARAALDRDFTFWRMVLRSADSVMTKVVAASALERNLTVGNLVLRDLHAMGKPGPPPAAWTQPLTREERSMRRAYAGEYVFQSEALAAIPDAPGFVSTNRIKDTLMRPLFQLQATNNMRAEVYALAADRFDADYEAMPAALEADKQEQSVVDESFHAYNPVGHVLHSIAGTNELRRYAARVSDLEALRRAVLLAGEVRAMDNVDVDALVRGSEWKDPYTNAPFAWDPKGRSIVCTGLQPGGRGRHAVLL